MHHTPCIIFPFKYLYRSWYFYFTFCILVCISVHLNFWINYFNFMKFISLYASESMHIVYLMISNFGLYMIDIMVGSSFLRSSTYKYRSCKMHININCISYLQSIIIFYKYHAISLAFIMCISSSYEFSPFHIITCILYYKYHPKCI